MVAQTIQAQKMESIGRLAGGIAHDFNNLLTVINGYSDLILRNPDLSARLRDRIENIRKSGERAAELTRQLLSFSRKQVIKLQPLNLNTAVSEVEGMLRRLIPETIGIVLSLDEDLPWILADPGQMHQLLMKLALNAIDAMPDGGTLILETQALTLDSQYVNGHSDVTEGPCVMLAVSDNGVGMSEETVGKVFEPFFTTKPLGSGTGLGLATVHGIVNQNGGWIWVYSEPGQGTTFKVYLPMLTAPPRQSEPHVAIQPHRGTATVLVVEDQEDLRNLVIEVLESHGYRALGAPNGSAALEASSDRGLILDLLLTDVVLPGISGKELADQMVLSRPGLKILYMSGYTENVIVTWGVLKPGIDFLPKPLSPESLLARVGELFSVHNSGTQGG